MNDNTCKEAKDKISKYEQLKRELEKLKNLKNEFSTNKVIYVENKRCGIELKTPTAITIITYSALQCIDIEISALKKQMEEI